MMKYINDIRQLKDYLFYVIVIIGSIMAFIPLFHMIISVLIIGGKIVIETGWSFFTDIPPSPISNTIGGIAPAFIGTLILMILSTIIALPIAFFASVLAVEYPHNMISKIVKSLVNSLTEIPTILVGILIYTVVVIPMGRFSAIAGALALAIVSLPYIYTYIENSLSTIPFTYREAAYSLGMCKAVALFKVFIGIARRGILTGILMGLAKASGETAPLLFTAGASRHIIFNGIDQPVDAIPLLIYHFILTPYDNYHKVAWGAAFVLLVIFLSIFTITRLAVKKVVM